MAACPFLKTNFMILTTPEQIEAMKEGGKILSAILKELKEHAKIGVTTKELDTLARELISRHGVQPSFEGYDGYPAVLCTCINEEAVHALPSDRKLQEGDLLKLDFGVVHKGLHTDSAISILISEDPTKKEYKDKMTLIRVTREALYAGIAKARVGNTVGDIGAAVQDTVEKKNNFKVVLELGGHGIGEELHESPWVGNFGVPGEGEKLVPGMAIAIEPVTSMGGWKIKDGADGFAHVMKDKSLSAHFEHTVIITEKGPLIVTE